MDENELEKKLYHDLNLDVKIPNKCEEIIREGLNKKKQHHSILKTILLSCASLMITIGVVYAGSVIYDKVWKTPEKMVGFYGEENNNTDIIENQMYDGVISKKEAKEKAEIILEKFGYKDEKIKSMELSNYSNNYELTWRIEMENEITLEFDAKGGNYLNIRFNNILHKDIENYRTTKEKAESTARELCKNYGYDLTQYNDIEVSSNLISENDAYIWYTDFKKEYDGFVNPYESIYVGFVPEINELYYFIVYNTKYDNNPVNITKEEAIETAINNEEKIDVGYEITSTSASLDIVKMNGDAYLRSMDYTQYKKQQSQNYPIENYVEYRTEALVRKAWKVTIEYDIGEEKNRILDETGITYRVYTYYIDATTGEIIGGTPNLVTIYK